MTARRFWFQMGFPAITVVLACFTLYHFAVVHRGTLVTPRPESPMAGAAMRWPPAPDSAALSRLRLPLSAPFRAETGPQDSRVSARWIGELTLDGAGLHLRPTPESLVSSTPGLEPARVDSIFLALAEAAPSGWRIARRGAAWIPPSGPFAPPAELSVPDVAAVDLADRWPVLVHDFHFENMPGDVHTASLPLQGRRDDLERLLDAGDPR